VHGDFEEWSEELRLLAHTASPRSADLDELVLLSQVLSHPCNIGYETSRNMRLVRLNGQSVRSLAHLKVLVDACERRGPLVFEFSSEQIVVIDAAAAEQATLDVSH
jgi:hypothetical protein